MLPGRLPRAMKNSSRFFSFVVRVPWHFLHLGSGLVRELGEEGGDERVLRTDFGARAVAVGTGDLDTLSHGTEAAQDKDGAL